MLIRKFLTLFMILGLCISLVSCGTAKKNNENNSKVTASKTTSNSAVYQTTSSPVSASSKTNTSPVSTASASKLALGQSYGGGVIFYIFLPEDPGFVAGEQHGLIVANEDVTKTYTDA